MYVSQESWMYLFINVGFQKQYGPHNIRWMVYDSGPEVVPTKTQYPSSREFSHSLKT